ncbi:hypothetical protein HELRODRAFT_164341 [Helobdella robusta]|uniref:Uncharacterized protein n=1 Tax=Helobdella robusta TaxID=6412 RepID=T1EVA4_HELRO|nr:hypothetical protein HELRODRAFT_164341 [Helobdella robusta]ESN94486.1 hypothetical protein HELRODRAFT_164341 [Helobdella robusta]
MLLLLISLDSVRELVLEKGSKDCQTFPNAGSHSVQTHHILYTLYSASKNDGQYENFHIQALKKQTFRKNINNPSEEINSHSCTNYEHVHHSNLARPKSDSGYELLEIRNSAECVQRLNTANNVQSTSRELINFSNQAIAAICM